MVGEAADFASSFGIAVVAHVVVVAEADTVASSAAVVADAFASPSAAVDFAASSSSAAAADHDVTDDDVNKVHIHPVLKDSETTEEVVHSQLP